MSSKIPSKDILMWTRYNWGLKCTGTGYLAPRLNSQVADCACPFVFDSYNFCSMGCSYCFASPAKLSNPAYTTYIRDKDGKAIGKISKYETESPLRGVNPRAFERLISGRAKDDDLYKAFVKDRFVMHWGSLTDPFCHFERANKVGLEVLKVIAKYKYPTLIGFKGPTIFDKEYVDFFKKQAKHHNFAFQVSIVTADDRRAAWLEVGVPPPSKRFRAIKMLSDMGYYVILRMRPYVIGVTDDTADEILERAAEAGAKAVTTEFVCFDTRHFNTPIARPRLTRVGEVMGISNIEEYFKKLSPGKRGSYLRLNWKVKEPFVKRMYKKCLEVGLVFNISDPDFKDLNMRTCCCGLPDDYPENPEMTNWSSQQQTRMVIEMRKEYWRRRKAGEKNPLVTRRFREIYCKGDRPTDYLYAGKDMLGYHIKSLNLPRGLRQSNKIIDIIEEEWNNLRSPASPYRYFFGKVLPVGTDRTGDVIYAYKPLPYEKEWIDEGIDLSK